MAYEPGVVPNDPAELPGFLRQELDKIQRAFYGPQKIVWLEELNVAPAKPRNGMTVFADGTNFKPNGVGARGVWRYDSNTATYVSLG